MSNRISTSMIYNQSLSSISARQSSLNKIQQQMATMQKMVTAKDDPIAAGTAVSLDRAVAALDQFGKNANNVESRLGLQENALTEVGDMMSRINELTVQANSGALSDDNRKAISQEISTIKDTLLNLANSVDGSGRYLFGGTSDKSKPFAIVNGNVLYSGDQTQRRIEVAPELFVTDTKPGSELFLRIPTGTGRVDATAAAANTGTGLITGFDLVDSTQWDGKAYTVSFTGPNTYEVLDLTDLTNTPVSTGTYKTGESINFKGLRMEIRGAPATGDQFEIGPSGTRDVFATIDQLMSALQMQPTTDAQRTAQQNALQKSMRDIDASEKHIIDARAAGGAQMHTVDISADLRESQALTLKTSLSSLRDLDFADAASRFTLESTALEAAQISFTQVQKLSLFSYLK